LSNDITRVLDKENLDEEKNEILEKLSERLAEQKQNGGIEILE
jgi:hypothetical protein